MVLYTINEDVKTKKIKITIRSLEESFDEAKKFFSDLNKGILKKHTPIIGFTDFETYKRILTLKRLELLKVIKLKKPKTIKELADITKRNFKNVYTDIKILERLELVKLKKTNSGLMPNVAYDEINLDIKIPLEMPI